MEKIYYKLIFTQTSPLHIGSKNSNETDSDIMLDGNGRPFIPGTSLAGIIRHRAAALDHCTEQLEKDLFGFVSTKKSDNSDMASSALIVGDAVLCDDNLNKKDIDKKILISTRNGVGLNEWGTTVKGAKFDFQVSETSELTYQAILEWTGTEDSKNAEITKILEPVLQGYVNDGICVGAKTTRGYGKFNVTVMKRTFTFPEDIDSWLSFKPYADSDAFDHNSEILTGEALSDKSKIEISFRLAGTFAVGVATSRVDVMEDGTIPDSVPLENIDGKPVISGTSWAGVFRHHMHALMRNLGYLENAPEMKKLDRIFGKGDKPADSVRSSITFNESIIENSTKICLMRNGIERFTAGTKNNALYTDLVCAKGNGNLVINMDKSLFAGEFKLFRQLLAACICDMQNGLMTVGKKSSVGMGRICVTDIKIENNNLMGKLDDLENGSDLNWFGENNADE